jgi:hypothetical protein
MNFFVQADATLSCPDIRESPPCSFRVPHSRRSQDAQGRLLQGDTARISYGPKGVENGSNDAVAEDMGRGHATHRQCPSA